MKVLFKIECKEISHENIARYLSKNDAIFKLRYLSWVLDLRKELALSYLQNPQCYW